MKKVENKKIKKLDTETIKGASIEHGLAQASTDAYLLERHFLDAYQRTGNKSFFELGTMIRKLRSKIMIQFEGKDTDYDVHCMIKHVFGIYGQLQETSQKLQSDGKIDEAMLLLKISYDYYQIAFILKDLGNILKESKKDKKKK